MTDFTETEYAEDFQWRLDQLIDELMHEGMARETAVMVMKMAIEGLAREDDEDDGQPTEQAEWHDFDPDC